jgi:hypothetical protein
VVVVVVVEIQAIKRMKMVGRGVLVEVVVKIAILLVKP